jgi:hypothetical protein
MKWAYTFSKDGGRYVCGLMMSAKLEGCPIRVGVYRENGGLTVRIREDYTKHFSGEWRFTKIQDFAKAEAARMLRELAQSIDDVPSVAREIRQYAKATTEA